MILNELIYFCAVILPYFLAGGLVGYFLVAKNKISAWRLISLSFLGAILAWFLTSLFKHNFPSPRPFEILVNVKPLFAESFGDSFPSGHATFLGALAIGVWLQNKKLGLVFIIGALLIAVARVLAYVHWPIDVIVGLLFGALVAILVRLIYNNILVK